MKKYIVNKNDGGFTLIEVLVALAILAVASASLIKVSAQALRQSSALEERTIAYWVAENTITQMQLDHEMVASGDRSEVVQMASREWSVNIHVIDTADPDLKRADVSVKLKSSPKEVSLATLTGFVGKH